MKRMIIEEHELLVVAEFRLQSMSQPLFWLFVLHLGSSQLDFHSNCCFLQTSLRLIRLNLKSQTGRCTGAVRGLNAGFATLGGGAGKTRGAASTGPANGPPNGTFIVTLTGSGITDFVFFLPDQ